MWRFADDTKCGKRLALSPGRFIATEEGADPTAGLDTLKKREFSFR
jgi:hypothetical protein